MLTIQQLATALGASAEKIDRLEIQLAQTAEALQAVTAERDELQPDEGDE